VVINIKCLQQSQMFSTASSVLFFILGQVLVVFYKHTAIKSDLRVNELLSIHHQLSVATKHLTNCFTPILLTSCVHIFLSLIFYSQSFLNLVCVYNQLSQTIWDGLWILDCFIRLWLICSTADSIRRSVSFHLQSYIIESCFFPIFKNVFQFFKSP